MAEPKNRNSPEWRDWYVRHTFGGTFTEMIKITSAGNGSLDILVKFINDVQKTKVKKIQLG